MLKLKNLWPPGPVTDFPHTYGQRYLSTEVLAMQQAMTGFMNVQLDILKMTWYKVKEEPCQPAPQQ